MAGPAISISRKRGSERSKLRTTNGAYLIELLASLLISGFLTAILAQSLSEVIRVNTKTDRSLIAVTIAQDLIERVRATPFSELENLDATDTYVQINLPETGTYAPASNTLLAKRPLQIDVTSMKWGSQTSTSELPKYSFKGTAKVSIKQTSPDIEAKTVIVRIEWFDSNLTNKQNVYETGTVISRFGVARHEE